jgi:hypothetical protein
MTRPRPGHDDRGLWATCPECYRRLLLARVDIPATIARGQMFMDMREVTCALELHLRDCRR